MGCRLKKRPALDKTAYLRPFKSFVSTSADRTITNGSAAGSKSKREASETSKIRQSVNAAARKACRPPDSKRDKNAFDRLLRQASSSSVHSRRRRNSRRRA